MLPGVERTEDLAGPADRLFTVASALHDYRGKMCSVQAFERNSLLLEVLHNAFARPNAHAAIHFLNKLIRIESWY